MDSQTINGSVVAAETVIAKILNKDQWCHHGRSADVSKIMRQSWKCLTQP